MDNSLHPMKKSGSPHPPKVDPPPYGLVGTFMTSPKLDLITIKTDLIAHRYYLRRSIYLCLSWLQANVLTSIHGLELKKWLLQGINFTLSSNRHLILSCYEHRLEMQRRGEAVVTSRELLPHFITNTHLYVTECGEGQVLILAAQKHDDHIDLIAL